MFSMMRKNLIWIALIVLASIVFFGLTLRGVVTMSEDPEVLSDYTYQGAPFESSHERATFAQMISMLKEKSFSLSKPWADFGSPDIGYADGKFHSFFPPGLAIAIMPLYILGYSMGLGQLLAFTTSAVFAMGAMIFIYIIGRQVFNYSAAASFLAALIFGFATTSWSYSITVFQHAATAFLMLAAFYFVWRFARATGYGWIWGSLAWLAYGLSITIDYPNALLLLPIMVYFLISAFSVNAESEAGGKKRYYLTFRTSIVLSMLTFIAVAGALLYYNFLAFGSYTTVAQSLPRYVTTNYEKLQEAERLKLLGQAPPAESSGGTTDVFEEESLVTGTYILSVAPDKGLFYFSPILILGLLGIFMFRHKLSLSTYTLLGIALVNWFVYASFGDPWGGWAFGPRYLIPAMAVLALFVPAVITGRAIWFKKLAVFVLAAYSFAVAMVGVMTSNLVPPKVEADFLGLKYGIANNLQLLKSGKISSFAYNEYLKDMVSINQFLLLVGVLFLILLFLAVYSSKDYENQN
jgi:hypothetical protein